MMELKPDNGLLEVRVNGLALAFRADSAFAEKAARLGREAEERAAAAAAGVQDPQGVSAFLIRALDTLLGEGTVATVFGEGEIEILDLLDLLDLVMSEFHRYRAARIARLKEGTV
ncbi:MAG: hypothetical protein IJD10_02470 [Clostridia bacterium]|nr:hypothetical protein [Clostridia bacterium]